jgi:hypothetical protein
MANRRSMAVMLPAFLVQVKTAIKIIVVMIKMIILSKMLAVNVLIFKLLRSYHLLLR